jgi:hypothetical protein
MGFRTSDCCHPEGPQRPKEPLSLSRSFTALRMTLPSPSHRRERQRGDHVALCAARSVQRVARLGFDRWNRLVRRAGRQTGRLRDVTTSRDDAKPYALPIPSFCIRERSVLGFTPRRAAAPLGTVNAPLGRHERATRSAISPNVVRCRNNTRASAVGASGSSDCKCLLDFAFRLHRRSAEVWQWHCLPYWRRRHAPAAMA